MNDFINELLAFSLYKKGFRISYHWYHWNGVTSVSHVELTLVIVEDSKCVSVLVSKELSHHNIRVLLNQTKISENVNKLLNQAQ